VISNEILGEHHHEEELKLKKIINLNGTIQCPEEPALQ